MVTERSTVTKSFESRAPDVARKAQTGQFVTTQPFGLPNIVNLNSIMVDGTGMCGACRVEVGGETRFACVDGPELDEHQVDWDLLMARQHMYLEEET
jgi:hypothetical protein